MRFYHYSDKPLKRVYSVGQDNNHLHGVIFKPKGLWFSTDGEDGWIEWCKGEQFMLNHYTYINELEFKSDANVLILSSAPALDQFTSEYGIEATYPFRLGTGIDWKKLAKKHQAIVIAPYVWERRLKPHTFWYYGWDCASGVVWDKSAVKSVKLLGIRKP